MPAYTPGGQKITGRGSVTYPARPRAAKVIPRSTTPTFGLSAAPSAATTSFIDRLSRYGLRVGPGGPGTGPQLQGPGATAVSHPTPASQAAAYEAASARGIYSPPTLTSLGGGGGGGGGGGTPESVIKELKDIQWKSTTFNTGSGTAPSWWTQQIPASADDAADPRVNFMTTLNSMIPYLSPEDQRNAAAQLYAMDADHWSAYKPEAIQTVVPVTEETSLAAAREGTAAGPAINREYFTSRLRARDAINMLNQVREQTVGGNRWQISPQYTLLQQILGGMEQFGGGASSGQFGGYTDIGRQTRSQQLAMAGALDPLMAQAKSPEAGGFGMIAQLLSQPFFSQGSLSPTYQGPGGRVLFGRPNQVLF